MNDGIDYAKGKSIIIKVWHHGKEGKDIICQPCEILDCIGWEDSIDESNRVIELRRQLLVAYARIDKRKRS